MPVYSAQHSHLMICICLDINEEATLRGAEHLSEWWLNFDPMVIQQSTMYHVPEGDLKMIYEYYLVWSLLT